MNDATLALIGISAGVGSAVGGWAALWWRDRRPRPRPTKSNRALVRKVYIHLDDIIGATKTENQLRAGKRFKVQRWLGQGTRSVATVDAQGRSRSRQRKKLGTAVADFFWPVPQLGTGTAALPSPRTMGRYVQVSDDLRTWTIHYTSEAAANSPAFIEWLTKGRPTTGGGLAQALGLEWREGMFEVRRNWSEGLVRFTLKDRGQDRPARTQPHGTRATVVGGRP
jgi:hypothetical protein